MSGYTVRKLQNTCFVAATSELVSQWKEHQKKLKLGEVTEDADMETDDVLYHVEEVMSLVSVIYHLIKGRSHRLGGDGLVKTSIQSMGCCIYNDPGWY